MMWECEKVKKKKKKKKEWKKVCAILSKIIECPIQMNPSIFPFIFYLFLFIYLLFFFN